MACNRSTSRRLAATREFFASHHIQLALATGASIIALAFVSKRVLAEPMNDLAMALPPFVALVAEGVITKNKGAAVAKTGYWVAAILLATLLVVVAHLA